MLVDPIDDACAATRFSKKNHALTIRAPLAPSAQSASAGPTDHSGSAAADPAEYLEADSVTPQAASETAEVARLSRMLKRTRCANCVASLRRADLRRWMRTLVCRRTGYPRWVLLHRTPECSLKGARECGRCGHVLARRMRRSVVHRSWIATAAPDSARSAPTPFHQLAYAHARTHSPTHWHARTH